MTSGKLITFEGVEGAGKSTLIAAVATFFRDRGRHVLITREPGATELGQRLRQLLLHELQQVSPRAELFMYLADRAEHIDVTIRPAVVAGQIVLCDRFSDSTIAYQGYGRQLPLTDVIAACKTAQNITIDRTYLLDLDPVVGLGRAKSRGHGADRLEREAVEFHQRVRAGFLELAAAEPKRVVKLDAALAPATLVQNVQADLQRWLALS